MSRLTRCSGACVDTNSDAITPPSSSAPNNRNAIHSSEDEMINPEKAAMTSTFLQ